ALPVRCEGHIYADRIPHHSVIRFAVLSVRLLHDRSSLLLDTFEAFTEIAYGKIDPPDGWQVAVYTSGMTNPAGRLPMGIEHALIRIPLVSITPAHLHARPPDHPYAAIAGPGVHVNRP